MRRTTLVFLLFSLPIFAALPICVRNYGDVPCTIYPSAYGYLKPYDPTSTKPICARFYDFFYCGEAPNNYFKVTNVDGDVVCVLNNNEPPVVNLCSATPQYYDYISEN